MRNLFYMGVLPVACLMFVSCDMKKNNCEYSAQVVVDQNGEVVGRFVEEKADTYVADTQDYFEVSKKDHRVVTFSACDGQGVVCIFDPEYDLPDCYECKGMDGDNFIVDIDGKTTLISPENAEWDVIDTY